MLQSLRGSFARSACAVCLLAASTVGHAASVTIDYALTSLAAPGRYQYSYTVTNVSLATPVSWFSVDFDPALYDEGTLAITSVGLVDWSELMLGSVIPFDPAQYDAYYTGPSPLGVGDSVSGFTVEFTWLGTGTPGSQAFTVYDSTSILPDVLYSGRTTLAGQPPPPPGVPEPSSLALVLLALGGTAALGRPSRRRPAGDPSPDSGSLRPVARMRQAPARHV